MSSPGDWFDDETPPLSHLYFPRSPEPIPLLDCMQIESTGLTSVSLNETYNPLMSSQQSNLMTYQETSPLLQNPLEMQQHQQQVLQQQQLGNSLETWLQDNFSNNFLSQSMLTTFQESSVFTRNQTQIGPVGQANNGLAHPAMTNSRIHRQGLLLPPPLIHEERSDAFGSLSHPDSIRSQNYLPYQTPRPVTSSFDMYAQQPPPPVFPSVFPSVFIGRQNEPHNLRMVNNIAMTCPLQNQTNMIPTFNAVPQRNISSIPRPQMSSRFTRRRSNTQRTVNQSSSRFKSSDLNTQTHIRPYANSIIPTESRVLGSRRSSYQSRLEFGQSSSSAQRRRIVSAGENIGAPAVNLVEQRQANKIYNPIYESLGLCIDPHLRKYSLMRMN